jgi:glycosyltransferase involved in cell wall biosynthesis
MNILIISHGIPSCEDPQWGCFELDQARALSRRDHRVTVAALDGRFRHYRRKRGITHEAAGPIQTYLFYLFPLKLLGTWRLISAVRARMMEKLFHRIVSEQGLPDIIVAHYLFSMDSLRRIRKKHPGIPVVGIEHWSRVSESGSAGEMRQRGLRAYGQVDVLLSVSASLQALIRQNFGMNSQVLHDMVDEVFFQAPLKKEKPVGPFRFLAVGSLLEVKGFDVLLKAFARTADPEAELVIVGAGPLREQLEMLCGELGIRHRVEWKGLLSRPEIVEIMVWANAYVLPSRSETFGVSYVEAMAMGLPVIATRCGGPESFMNEKCGLMVDVDDVDGLTAAMNRMEQGILAFNPEEIRDYIYSRFSGEVIAKQLEKVFEEAIKAKKR